ncbi:MAG: signal peptidase II [Acidimicrobiaceae bacterium]|nr:signal peptidase II [Acidimicrobiaceae bacterium]MYD07479.1 signal peptidase II [Acidimicrobiaceae bacterium]MYI58240.1 signal peptidase II [Acidimicrobiaceae bacterium]
MRSRKWQAVGIVIAVVLALDQLSKEWAINRLSGGRIIEILPTLELDLTYNSGFSFGTGAGHGPLVGTLVIALCGFICWRLCIETITARAAILSAILGGALGNLIDRVLRADDGLLSGDVVDFIDVTWYAVFNVADMFVVCGCIVLVLYELRHRSDAAELPSGEESS